MGKSFVHKGYCGPANVATVTPSIIHLYQHGTNHGPSAIVGNVEGLRSLRDAIDKLLTSQDELGKESIEAVPGDDGEGHSLVIYKVERPFTDRIWDDLPSTYEIPEETFGGDNIWSVECAIQQKWPCPVCNGFGKRGVKMNWWSPGAKRSDLVDESEATPCDGPCGGSGIVTEKPKTCSKCDYLHWIGKPCVYGAGGG